MVTKCHGHKLSAIISTNKPLKNSQQCFTRDDKQCDARCERRGTIVTKRCANKSSTIISTNKTFENSQP